MKLLNRTHWQTKHLRAIICRAMRRELPKGKGKHVKVYVVYGRGDTRTASFIEATVEHHIGRVVERRVATDKTWVSGCAWIGGYNATIRVSKEKIDKVDLALVAAHEAAHLAGMHHHDMRGSAHQRSRWRRVGPWRTRYGWAESLPLEKEPVSVKPSGAERKELQLQKARLQVILWERKLKRGNTYLRKWKRRVKYLERAVEAAPSIMENTCEGQEVQVEHEV